MGKKIKDEDGNTYVQKKPIYERVWFWVIVIIILGGIGSQIDNGSNSNANVKTTKISKKVSDNSDGINRVGGKLHKKGLTKDSAGFWEDTSGERITTENGKIIAIKIPFSSGGKGISPRGALARYRELTSDDLIYESGSTYHSDKQKRYYHIDESTKSDGTVLTSTIYLGK